MDENDSFSMNSFIELGMGMAIAQQMAQHMGGAFQAGLQASNAHSSASPPQFHVVLEGRAVGPIDVAGLAEVIRAGRFTRESWIWMPGMAAWQQAADVAEIQQHLFTVPPPPPEGLVD